MEKVTQGGQTPAYGFVPPGILGDKAEYRKEYPDDFFKEDTAGAKALLAKGLQEKGLSAMPTVSLLINDGTTHKKVAEAVVDMWRKNLGIEVKIQTQEWKVFLKSRQSLDYTLARAGWSADYNDPMTFIDLFTSKGGNNDLGFSNSQYDDLVKQAYATADQPKRMKIMNQAEKILVQDNMAILPLYYYSAVYLVKPNLQHINVDYQGQVDYTRAYYA